MRVELIAIPAVTMPGLASNYRRQKYRSFADNLLNADVLRHFIAA